MRWGVRGASGVSVLCGCSGDAIGTGVGRLICYFLARAWPIGAFDKHPVARADVGPIIPDRIMLGAAIIPECDRMRRPAETHVPMRPRDMVVQEFQHAAAFGRRHFVNVTGELAIDEQRLAAAFRM